jgi:hypothetical protein
MTGSYYTNLHQGLGIILFGAVGLIAFALLFLQMWRSK